MYKITKDGVALDPKLYTIDEANRTFISEENGLVIDFAGKSDWLFRIRNYCTVTADNDCFIDARNGCNITTGDRAVMRVCDNSTITAGDRCTITTKHNCTITTGERCTLDTGSGCNITTGDGCTIDADYKCHISTSHNAVIRAYAYSVITGGKNCVVIRRVTNEVIKLVAGQTIRLNGYDVEGYEVIKPIETIEIEGQKYNKKEVEDFLKNLKQLINY